MPHMLSFFWKKHAPNLLGVSASPGITPEIRKIKGNHGAGREQDLEMVIIRHGYYEREMGKTGRGKEGHYRKKGGEGISK